MILFSNHKFSKNIIKFMTKVFDETYSSHLPPTHTNRLKHTTKQNKTKKKQSDKMTPKTIVLFSFHFNILYRHCYPVCSVCGCGCVFVYLPLWKRKSQGENIFISINWHHKFSFPFRNSLHIDSVGSDEEKCGNCKLFYIKYVFLFHEIEEKQDQNFI